jgi:predicted site-specific integrase-resolvase
MLKDIYTVKEASERFDISEETISSWINAKRFHSGEIKNSAGTWLLDKDGIIRILAIEKLDRLISAGEC